MILQKLKGTWIPLVAIGFGLLAGAIIMLLFGYNPIQGYIALWNGAFENPYFTGETIRLMTPYILSGLAVAFAFRSGLLNIGVEGQVFVGWLAAVWVGTAFSLPAFIHLPLAILAAAVAGGLWGFVPGYLKAKYQVHEVIITIMMNYIALYSTNAIIRNVLTDQGERTDYIAESASLKSAWLTELMEFSNIHFGIILAIFSALFYWYFIEKTKYGFELKAVGFNRDASKYAGMSVKRSIIMSMVISGGFAGLAGAMEGLGTFGYMSLQNSFTNIGFDGIAIALLGGNTAIGVILASGLFGVLKNGALNMPTSAGVPHELVDIITALIIFFVAASYMIILFREQIISMYHKLKHKLSNISSKEGK
ncbi:ABC transporter permease [Tenuibacillus multivorans]|uniref:Simple sugar transport system permease protein n=1 Tax=Tenuibacillus multivorans TaxID=237069 RepID=A0A1G9XU57_9BACI|nr:ABC transporter permease [Tenuibacillus multivorans]GEL75816.1 putative ABC transporter permease protein YufP [Tenuibacillus multivorans]SDN00270.1 simple sugar transport system permease protein [Tenuibacillus multivorans]